MKIHKMLGTQIARDDKYITFQEHEYVCNETYITCQEKYNLTNNVKTICYLFVLLDLKENV